MLVSVASLSRAAFPVMQAGRHPRLHFRGLLRLHARYGPSDCSTAQGGLCRKASARPVTPPSRLPATRSNRLLSGWNPPPLVIRAVGAHVESRTGAVAGRAGAVSRPRSSNRTCGFPASGFPTGFIAWPTAAVPNGRVGGGAPSAPNTVSLGKRRVPCEGTLCRRTRKCRTRASGSAGPMVTSRQRRDCKRQLLGPRKATRLEQIPRGIPWQRWGPYVSERQWGPMREDNSERGRAWEYSSHDHARSHAYRWGRTASPASATAINGCASCSDCGMGATQCESG